MARGRHRSARRGSSGRSKLDTAKKIVRSMTTRGASASTSVHAAVRRAGISTRTYRTARKQVRAVAMRRSKSGAKARRGAGRWYVKRR